MCKAIDEMIEDGRKEGRSEGIKALIETCEELGVSPGEVLSKVIDKFDLQEENIEEYLELYWKGVK